jgi:tetratricopeptide (TPR) repeat protein
MNVRLTALVVLGLCAVPPAGDEPPYQRLLQGDDATRAEASEKRIEELREAGSFQEAQAVARTLLELRRRVQGDNHWQTGDANRLLNTLEKIAALPAEAQGELARAVKVERAASQLDGQGHYTEATPLRRHQLEIYEHHLGEACPETADAYNNLAGNLYFQGKYVEAEPLFQKALAIRHRTLGEAHPHTAESYNDLGLNLYSQGKYLKAEPLHQKALTIRRQALGEAHRRTADSYNNLALSLNAQGKHGEAEPLYRKALAIWRQTLGEAHPDTASGYSNLGRNLDSQGKYSEVEPLLQKALAIRRQALGEAHPRTATSYDNLALSLYSQGKYGEAEPLYRKALAIRRQALGEAHPRTATSYNNLALSLYSQGKYGEAEPLYREALAIDRQALGEAHPETATSYNNLADNLNAQGKYGEAEPLYQKALAIRRQALREAHRRTADSYNNLAHNLDAQGKHDEAEPLHRAALAIYRQTVGEGHADTATSHNNLAHNLNAQGKHGEAESLHRAALAIYRQALGEAHPRTATSYNNLALSLYSQGKYGEAEPLYREALAIHRQALGEAHRRTADSYNNLAHNLDAQGKHGEAQALWILGERVREVARLRTTSVGLERAYFDSRYSNLPLITSLARAGQTTPAWRYLEASLARGLLDELSASRSQSLPEADQQRVRTLSEQLSRLEKEIAALLTAKELAEQLRGQVQRLIQQRQELETELTRIAAAQSSREVYDLERVQSRLPPEAALVAWVDVQGKPGATDANREHWACVLRHKGPPVWVQLPGSGPQRAWTQDDDDLLRRLRRVLRAPGREALRDEQTLLTRVLAQRLTPLEPCLRGNADNLAAKHLLVESAWWMAGVPIEALTDDYTISYVPSGTLFARLREQRRESTSPASQAPRLLAVGAPNFQRPAPPVTAAGLLPESGLLISQVVPDSNAAQSGIRAGDVLLGYAGMRLSALADLKRALSKQPEAKSGEEVRVPVEVWRDGKTLALRVRQGPLGIQTSPRPAKEEVLAKQDGDRVLRASRGKGWKDLPGARREITAIAPLFDRPVTLLGSEASEQRLDQLAVAGELQQFRYLHFATHGEVNARIALESGLILAQDRLPDPVDQILGGEYPYDGRLTAAEMRRWKLDAELVTLSACETGLGERLGGEGYLGFAQALFTAGARSVVLSLWPVDDLSTALLMSRFYQNVLGKRAGLAKPLPKAEALREAKQWLRQLPRADCDRLAKALSQAEPRGALVEKDDKPVVPAPRSGDSAGPPYADPYYWAPFILLGDPE